MRSGLKVPQNSVVQIDLVSCALFCGSHSPLVRSKLEPQLPLARTETMRPSFQADLVNDVFGDPGVYIDLKFQNRALLFDIGDVSDLPTRKLLRVSDVFVSHTHMDHFAGFDQLLRVCLGRDWGVRLYGPPQFIDQVGHKLHAYTWNLVENYTGDFIITAHELHNEGLIRRARFRSHVRFEREDLPEVESSSGTLLSDDQFQVKAQAFDHHGLPS